MGNLCGGEGEPITYEELIPPETRQFRKGLYDYLGGWPPRYTRQIPSYPGQLPYTQMPDMGQLAGIGAILQLLGYPGYTWQGIPGLPGGGADTDAGKEPPDDTDKGKRKRELPPPGERYAPGRRGEGRSGGRPTGRR